MNPATPHLKHLQHRARGISWVVPVAGAALVMTVLLWSAFYLREHWNQLMSRASAELEIQLNLKAEQLVAWRSERIGDANAVSSVPSLRRLLELEKVLPEDEEALRRYLEQVAVVYRYHQIVVYDQDWRVRLATGGEEPVKLPEEVRQRVREAKAPFFGDLHRAENGRIFLDVLTPWRPVEAGASGGAVLLRIDARDVLFPIVSYWPVSHRTAESFLLHKQERRYVALTELRGRADAPLQFSLLEDTPDLAVVQALNLGRPGVTEGRDYRGERVIVAARPLDGTPWILVAKIDRSEVTDHLRGEILGLIIAGGLIVLSASLLVWGYVRRSLWEAQAKRLEAEQRKVAAEARLGLVMGHANDAVLVFDESGKLIEANERACTMYGLEHEKLIGRDVSQIRAPSALPTLPSDFSAALENGMVFETRHQRASGTEFPVEVSTRAVQLDGRRHILSVVREVGVRKAHEMEIQRLSRFYQLISHINQAIVRQKSRGELFSEVCEVIVQSGEFRLAWIGWLDAGTKLITPVAVAGDAAAYAAGIRVSSDEAVPEGRGPTGAAVREGRVQVTNDLPAEQSFGPWREAAIEFGLVSSVAVPILVNRAAVGALMVYSADAQAFGLREVAVLQDVARDLAHALEVLRTKDAKAEAERALFESEHRLQHLLGNTPAVIYSLDPHTFEMNYVSANVRHLLGRAPEDFCGDTHLWRQIIHPEDAKVAFTPVSDLTTRDLHVRQYRLRHQDGHYVWLHDETRVLRDADGRISELVGHWTDITERVRDEELVRKLSRAIEQNPASIVITDLDGAIEYVNPRFTEVTGYTMEEVAGRNPRMLKSGRTVPAVYADLWGTITTGAVWRGEIINQTKSGAEFIEWVVITPVVDAQGRSTHYVAVKEDITQRKAVEERLRKLSRTIEQAPLSVAITNLDGSIEYVNPKFTEVSGYTLEEAMGQNPRILKSGDTPPEVYQAMWSTLTNGGVWRGELSNRKKNGEIYIESAVIAPVAGPDGQTTHYVALKEDITSRKQTEAALRETRERQDLIAANISDVVWLYDLAATRYTYMSPSVRAVFGRAPEDYLTRSFDDSWVRPEDVEETRALLEERLLALSAGETDDHLIQLEVAQQHVAGHWVPTEVHVTLLMDATGRLTRALGVTRDITERKRAAAALEESERLYRLIADNTSDATWVFDLATNSFSYMSPASERLLGVAPAEIVGRSFDGLLTARAQEEVARSLPARIKGYQAGDATLRTRLQLLEHVHRDGRLIHGEVVTTLLVGPDGRVAQILGVSRDVTQRKLAEDALVRSRDRLANAEQMAHLGNWELALPEWRMVWSDEMFGIFELPKTEDRGVTWEQFRHRIHPDDLARSEAGFLEFQTQQARVRFDQRLRFEDGRIKHVEMGGEAVRNEKGEIRSILGTAQDVTDRKTAEVELQELVKQLRAFQEVSLALEDRGNPVAMVLDVVATQLPRAMRDPSMAQAEVSFAGIMVRAGVAGRRRSEIVEQVRVGNKEASIAVGYVDVAEVEPGAEDYRPEERDLVKGIARALGIALNERESIAQLRTSEERFRAIFDLAEVGMFETTVDGRMTRANRFLGQMLQVEPPALVGKRWSEFCPALAGGDVVPPSDPIEVTCRRADGTEFWGSVSSNAEFDDAKLAVGRIGLWRDITAEVEARETLLRFNSELEVKVAQRTAELATRNREVQALVQAIPDLVVQMRADGTVVDLEPARGATRLSAIGEPTEAALRSKMLDEVRILGLRALASEVIVSVEKEIDAGLVVDLRAAPSSKESFVALVRDITVRKKLEEETVRMLEQAKEVAAMKTRFISVTSHEFRTPMAAALGSVDLLQNHAERIAPAKREELFERVRTSLRRMTEMLDDVLTLNRIDAKRTEAKLVPVNLSAQVRSVLEETRAADRGAHRFEHIVVDEVAEFVTDTTMLQHILSNLLSNAARYSPAGTTIVLRQAVVEGQAEIAVEDHGIGVPVEDRGRIFEPFERASNVGEIKGTGLGLNIVKRMTEQLHGTITLESPATGGSRFVVRLPVVPRTPP